MKNLRNRKWTLANRPVGMVGEHNFSYEEEEVRDIEDAVSYTHLTLPTTPYV